MAYCFTGTAPQAVSPLRRRKPHRHDELQAADIRRAIALNIGVVYPAALNAQSRCNRLQTSSLLKPCISIVLSRDFSPRFRTIAFRGSFSCSARKSTSAAFAFPSTAGARTLILIAPSTIPVTLATFAFGTT